MGAAFGCAERDPKEKDIKKEEPYREENEPYSNGNGNYSPVKEANSGSPTRSEYDESPNQSESTAFYWGASARTAGSAQSGRFSSTSRSDAMANARLALHKLSEGNRRYRSAGDAGDDAPMAPMQSESGKSEVTAPPCALVACCSPPPAPLEVIFDVSNGELACVASASQYKCHDDDGGAAAVEFAAELYPRVSLLIVLETLRPGLTVDNATNIVQDGKNYLLENSAAVRAALSRGCLHMRGALLDPRTGTVTFLNDQAEKSSPSKRPKLQQRSSVTGMPAPLENVKKPFVPVEQALAILQSGNLRAAKEADPDWARQAAAMQAAVSDGFKLVHTPRGTAEGNANTMVVMFMKFDPHQGDSPAVEQIFHDVHPSKFYDIDVLPPPEDVDGIHQPSDTDELWTGYVHMAEHCLSECSARLLLVFARVPRDIDIEGEEYEMVKEEVFEDMRRLLTKSKIITKGVGGGHLQLEGAIYHGGVEMPPGLVEWLGAHPEQHELAPGHRPDRTTPSDSALTRADLILTSQILTVGMVPAIPEPLPYALNVDVILQALQVGNMRYRNSVIISKPSGSGYQDRWRYDKLRKLMMDANSSPSSIIVSGATGVISPEEVFDSVPGQFLVHRTCGAIPGRRDGCALRCLESMIQEHESVRLVLILCDVKDPALDAAFAQVQPSAKIFKSLNAQLAIEQLFPAVVHSLRTESQGCVAEFLVYYFMERMLLDSDVIMGLACSKRLQVQGAVVQEDGSVKFIGGHSDLHRLELQWKKGHRQHWTKARS